MSGDALISGISPSSGMKQQVNGLVMSCGISNAIVLKMP